MRYFLTYKSEPAIRLGQVLWFINFYGYQNQIDYKSFTFEDGIEFKRSFQQDYFESLMQLHLEHAITLKFQWQTTNEFWRNNKELEKTLREYKDKDLFWQAAFDIASFRLNWDSIKDQIKQYDCFGYEIIVHWRRFLELMFCKISQEMWYLDIDREAVVESLYQYIIDCTNWKHNYNDQILLKYKFDDYLDNRRLILPLLVEMEELWVVKINDISIKDNYITFTISNIIDISEEEMIKIIKKIPWKFYLDSEPKNIEKIEYTQKGVKINDRLWGPKDSQKTEDFIKLVSMYFFENPNIKFIHITTIEDFYIKNKKLLNSELTINEKNIQNSYMRTFEKKLSDDYTWTFLQMDRWLIEAKEDFQNTTK